MSSESNPLLYTLTLRDKPLGYGAGNVGVASECPVCKAHGVRVSSSLVTV